ncbi:DUF368 domain-containing protein [Halalkalibacter krulwichiae]
MAMGISDLIPGVSGGTLALVLGIYQQLLSAINGLFTKEWKRHSIFLIPLGLGIVSVLLTLSHLIEWLLADYPQPTFFFFLGLIIGIIPLLLKEIHYKQTFTFSHYILIIVGAVIVGSTIFVKDQELAVVMSNLTASDFVLLFFAGWLASSAMILPGVSGSFIFLLLGVYPTVINALSTFNLPVIMTVGFGIAIGLVITSKLLSYLLSHYKTAVYALMVGFISGSVIVIYPGILQDSFLLFVSVIAFIAGLFTAYMLSYAERRKTASTLYVQKDC